MARIALIERFSELSRNCPLDAGQNADEVHVFHLHQGRIQRSNGVVESSADHIRRLTFEMLNGGIDLLRLTRNRAWTAGVKRQVVTDALQATGSSLSAVKSLLETARLLNSGPFERLDCYSVRGFPLVKQLSRMLALPYREFLASGTRYFGEFGFELLAVIPYAYWLHKTGRLQLTQSCADTSPLYYFSPRHQEFPNERSYIPVSEYPSMARNKDDFDSCDFPAQLDTAQWLPPPYKNIYANQTFVWPRELCVVCNKFTSEPSVKSGQVTNYLDVPELLELMKILNSKYQVIYVRPRASDIVNDHQPIAEFGDHDAIRREFPEVLTIQQIHAEHPGLSFNELQMKLFANCNHFVSVLGGSSYLASYFGGKNIVLGREGWEVESNAFTNWFHEFSGAKVIPAATSTELFDLVRREFF